MKLGIAGRIIAAVLGVIFVRLAIGTWGMTSWHIGNLIWFLLCIGVTIFLGIVGITGQIGELESSSSKSQQIEALQSTVSSSVSCPDCGGSGTISEFAQYGAGEGVNLYTRTCSTCGGSGYLDSVSQE